MTRTEELKARRFDASEWRKLYYKHQQQYISRGMEAIKYLQEVINQVGCARIDMYSQGGLPALCKPVKYHRKQKLDEQNKQELKKMLLEQKPTD